MSLRISWSLQVTLTRFETKDSDVFPFGKWFLRLSSFASTSDVVGEWYRSALLASLMAQWFKKKKKICLQCRRRRLDPWVGKIPWRRAWQPTPVFWPGESHGQRSLADYSLWGCKRVIHEWSDLDCTPSRRDTLRPMQSFQMTFLLHEDPGLMILRKWGSVTYELKGKTFYLPHP